MGRLPGARYVDLRYSPAPVRATGCRAPGVTGETGADMGRAAGGSRLSRGRNSRIILPLVAVACIATACSSGSSGKQSSKTSTSAASATTTTTAAHQTSVKQNCDLFTAAQVTAVFGVGFQNAVDGSTGCEYPLQQGAGQVTVSFAAASNQFDPNYGQTYYRGIARGGQPITVSGAAQAVYSSDTNPLGQVSESVVVLTKTGESFSIQLAGDDAPKNAESRLQALAQRGVQRIEAG